MVKPLSFCVALGIAVLSAGCGEAPDRVEVTESTVRSEYRYKDKVNASSDDRFRSQAAMAQAAQTPTESAHEDAPFHYSVPAGWTEIAPTQFRNPNFTIGPDGDMECYVSVLPGGGGGININLNRWRGQFGAPEYTTEEIDALPSVMIMGHPAKVANFSGAFKGMGETVAKPDYRLIGAMVQAPDKLITIKLTGPESKVMPQLNKFASFVDSLHDNSDGHQHGSAAAPPIHDGAQMPADHPPLPDASATVSVPDTSGGSGKYAWEAPEGWTVASAASPMRLVTFTVRDDKTGVEAECYITVLGGNGGGRLSNFNRWLGQFGQEPLEETELMLQPPLVFFNEEVPMLVVEGSYSGMSGTPEPNQMLIGASYEIDGESLFVKLVGPEPAVRANWSKFVVFCSSIYIK